MTRDEREVLFNSILTAPTMDELKIRYVEAFKKAIAANDPVSMRMLTAFKDEAKRTLNESAKHPAT